MRGLKLSLVLFAESEILSHSARSAWIETPDFYEDAKRIASHSARSAWIETVTYGAGLPAEKVALRKECVD